MKNGRLCIAVCWILCAAALARGQGGYPQSADKYVNDFANVLSDAEAAAVRERFGELRTGHGIEAVVVTIRSMSDYRTGQAAIEPFAEGLFNRWGIGSATENNGALLLVAIRDRQVKIELGAGYGRRLDAKMQAIVGTDLLPRFRSGRYGEGILAASRSLADALEAEMGGRGAPAPASAPAATVADGSGRAARAVAATEAPLPAEAPPAEAPPGAEALPAVASRAQAPAPAAPPPAPMVRRVPAAPVSAPPMGYRVSGQYSWGHRLFGGGFPGVLVAAAPLAVLGFLAAGGIGGGVALARRLRKRYCPSCQREMALLDEVSDDVFLDSGQKLEEMLGSIDWAVFRCPQCGTQSVESRRAWFSRYSDCPQCGRRTLETNRETISHATTMSTGRQRITRQCRNCSHFDEDFVTLPRLQETHHHHHSGFRGGMGSSSHSGSRSSGHGSSGGSSHFGGGRSGGGGASGSW